MVRAVSMATTPVAPIARVPTIGKTRVALESAMTGRAVAVPLRKRDVYNPMCARVFVKKVTGEIKAERNPSRKPYAFPLLDLYEFICSGPLLTKIGFTPEKVGQRIDEWLELGVKLSRQLQFDEFALSQSEKVRIYHYYVPVFLWCKHELETHTAKFKPGEPVPALVIGITAPQGCGKTTIVYSLEYLFNSLGSRAASILIDDFYLTAAEQKKLSASNLGNRLLEMRGNAGSHDLKLGTENLQALRCLTTSGKEMKLPRYDKSANGGLGDRADSSQWPKIEGPVKVVLFEGWMLGFEPQKESVVVDPQVADFVSRYMPAYKAYLPALYGRGPTNASGEHMLMLHIDESHNPVG